MKRKTVKEVVSSSDNFIQHEKIFLKAAKKLIWDGRLKKDDFEDHCGWAKSMQFEDTYYVIPKKSSNVKGRIFLNIKTGKIFRYYNEVERCIGYVEMEDKMTIKMPLMRPIPIPTKGKSWWKSLWIWAKTTRQWEIMEDWEFFISYLNLMILIPKGFIFDGASIPKGLRSIYSPVGILLLPGLLHDYGYRFGYLLRKIPGGFEATKINFTRKDWDNLFLKVSVQVNGFNVLNKLPRFGLWIGAGITWAKHRENNLNDPIFKNSPNYYSCTVEEAREDLGDDLATVK